MPTERSAGRNIKGKQIRDKKVNLRMSESELALIDLLCSRRKGFAWCSRTDVIVLAAKFALGEITAIDGNPFDK